MAKGEISQQQIPSKDWDIIVPTVLFRGWIETELQITESDRETFEILLDLRLSWTLLRLPLSSSGYSKFRINYWAGRGGNEPVCKSATFPDGSHYYDVSFANILP